MTRKPRLIVPDCPHHVTLRGNGRQQVFFGDYDYLLYLRLLRDLSTCYDVAVLGYCLMPDHVHLIVKPHDSTSLPTLLRQLQGDYARNLHKGSGRSGPLWQSRFYSEPLAEEVQLWNAVLHLEQNPARAHLVDNPAQWPWSSVRAHLGYEDAWFDDVLFRDRFTTGEWRNALVLGHPDAVSLERIHDYEMSAA